MCKMLKKHFDPDKNEPRMSLCCSTGRSSPQTEPSPCEIFGSLLSLQGHCFSLSEIPKRSLLYLKEDFLDVPVIRLDRLGGSRSFSEGQHSDCVLGELSSNPGLSHQVATWRNAQANVDKYVQMLTRSPGAPRPPAAPGSPLDPLLPSSPWGPGGP